MDIDDLVCSLYWKNIGSYCFCVSGLLMVPSAESNDVDHVDGFFTSRNGLTFLKFDIMFLYDVSIEITRCQCSRFTLLQ